jgi:hypothetical protein
MERRLLYSTYNVTNTFDDGSSGSLRWAVNQVNTNGGGTIDMSAVSGQTITLSNGQLEFTGSNATEIDGFGSAVDGGGVTRVFQVDSGASLTIFSLTISDGSTTGNGAAINNAGTLDVEGCEIQSNHAAFGGGIYSNAGSVTVNSTDFSQNSAQSGGGIFNTVSSLTINNSSFQSNTVPFSGGGIYDSIGTPNISSSYFSSNQAGLGGGVLILQTGMLSGCQFYNNTANSFGGGVYNSSSTQINGCYFSGNQSHMGGAIYNANGQPKIDSCSFNNNNATGGSSQGGAIYDASNVNLTVTNSNFNSNTATTGGAFYITGSGSLKLTNVQINSNTASGNGGGVYASGPSITMSQVIFNGNSANGFSGGGAMWNNTTVIANACTFDNNSGASGGGAVYQVGGVFRVTNSEFVGNSLTPGSLGGSAIDLVSSGSGQIINDTFTDNTFGGGGASHGAVLLAQPNGNGTVVNSIFWNDDNYLSTHPGNEYIVTWANNYGVPGLSVSFSNVRGGYPGTHNINVDPHFVRNADPGNGDFGDLHLQMFSSCINSGNNLYVSGIPLDMDGNPRIVSGTVDMGAHENQLTRYYVDYLATSGANNGSSWNNAFLTVQQALAAAAVAPSPVIIEIGQGTYVPGSSRTDTYVLNSNSQLYGGFSGTNTADPDARDTVAFKSILSGEIGAAGNADNVYNIMTASGVNSNALLDGLYIQAGNANGSTGTQGTGGGIYNDGGSPEINNVTFSGNNGTLGGAIYDTDFASPDIRNSAFNANTGGSGGGVYSLNSWANFDTDTFTGNTATSQGGAILNNNSSPSFNNVTFTSNVTSQGGAIANIAGSSPSINSSVFTTNQASSQGGAIYNNNSSPNIGNDQFTTNTANQGGAIANLSGAGANIGGNQFTTNTATTLGGAIYNSSSAPSINSDTFTSNTANQGGAIADSAANNSSISSCTFNTNHAGQGGGVYVISSTNVSIDNSNFNGNTATTGSKLGGGVFATNSTLAITNSNFNSNTAAGGAAGAIYFGSTTLTLTNDQFTGNTATLDGAVEAASGTANITSCTFTSNTATGSVGAVYGVNANINIFSSSFYNNSAAGNAGAIYMPSNGNLQLVNSQFVGNSITPGGSGGSAIYLLGSATATIDNDTFTDNTFGGGGGGHGAVLWVGPRAVATVTNSIFWNDPVYTATHPGNEYIVTWADSYNTGTASVSFTNVKGGLAGTGNINADPEFVQNADPANSNFGDLHLQASSPCINVGRNASIPVGVTTDFDGNNRIIGNIVDMGAFENIAPTVYVDYLATAGTNDGSSWANAFTSLQAALNAVGHPGDDSRIEVAQGTYLPSDPVNSSGGWLGTVEEVSSDQVHASLIITINPDSSITVTQTGFGPYDGGDDTAIDVINNSPNAIPALHLVSQNDIFGFDGDGVSTFINPTPPTGITGYEGPDNFFSNITTGGPNGEEGNVNFTEIPCGLPSGARTYFSLEDALTDVSATTSFQVVTFQLADHVKVLGGYAGLNTPNPDDHNVQRYPTILSGNVPDPDCVRCFHVVTGSGTDSTAVLDGFTVTQGNANGTGPGQNEGAGLFDDSGSPSINAVTFTQNAATNGAGVANINSSSPIFTNCVFTQNAAISDGGGMFNASSSSPSISGSSFLNDTATLGAGLFTQDSSATLSLGDLFYDNIASSVGGAVYSSNSNLVIDATVFNNNHAPATAGALFQTDGNLQMTNSQFVANAITGTSGGSAVGLAGGVNAQLVNNTFSDNTIGGSTSGAVLVSQSSASVAVTNSIFWNDTTYSTTHPGSTYLQNTGSGSLAVTYSDVKGGFTGTGNVNSDPLFIRNPNLAAGDYGNLELSSSSTACINHGNNAAVPSGIIGDLTDNPRFAGSSVDMGAYEFESTAVPTVTAFSIGYSDVAHTHVNSLTITFNQAVAIGAFTLNVLGGAPLPFTLSSSGNTTFTLTFPASLFSRYVSNQLFTGQFMLAINPSGTAFAGGLQYYTFASA